MLLSQPARLVGPTPQGPLSQAWGSAAGSNISGEIFSGVWSNQPTEWMGRQPYFWASKVDGPALQDHRWNSCRTGLVWVRPPLQRKKGCAAAALICSRPGISNSDAACGCDAGQVSMYRCLRAVHETRIHKGSLLYQVRSKVVAKIWWKFSNNGKSLSGSRRGHRELY